MHNVYTTKYSLRCAFDTHSFKRRFSHKRSVSDSADLKRRTISKHRNEHVGAEQKQKKDDEATDEFLAVAVWYRYAVAKHEQ